MTIKIELPDGVVTEAWDKFGVVDDMRAAITAALEAMVEEGTAKVAVGYGVAPDSHWVAEVGLPDGEHTFPAIIIRLGEKP